ncbi:MAG: hypothetical protein LBT46_09970, partial [Planctomycetaceae bacterium]|nr:hypothetical protein [Planctomycetaceae bacterium]
MEDMTSFFDYPIVKHINCSAVINIVCRKKREIVIAGHSLDDSELNGYFLFFNEQGKIYAYREGTATSNVIPEIEDKPINPYLYDKITKGIEITFHPTGYPANYRTIVKGRLFGRQIE